MKSKLVTKPLGARVAGFLRDWSLPRQMKGADTIVPLIS